MEPDKQVYCELLPKHDCSQPENPFFQRNCSSLRLARVSRFTLESGVTLKNAPVSYRIAGKLSDKGDNVVLVCHPLQGHPDFDLWWPHVVGKGSRFSLNTEQYLVICLGVMGCPYGSAGPVTAKDRDVNKGLYGPEFPATTIRDDVKLHRIVAEALGIEQIMMVIGGSVGGLHALEWAYTGAFIKSLGLISTSGKQNSYFLGRNEVQRQCIYMDPKFANGFYSLDDPPIKGLAVSYMSVLLQARSEGYFNNRFGQSKCQATRSVPTGTAEEDREVRLSNCDWEINNEGCSWLQPESHRFISNSIVNSTSADNDQEALESWLRQRSEMIARNFDANCMIAWLRKIDSHDVSRGRVPVGITNSRDRLVAALALIKQPTLVIGIPGDMLFSFSEQVELAQGISNCEFVKVESSYGHDMFLQDPEGPTNEILARFIAKTLESTKPKIRYSPHL